MGSGWDQAGDVDAWNADVLTEPELPRALAELRDGIAAPLPNQGAARQRRLEQMQRDIAACADFVADCDRYRENPASVLTPLVPKLMARHLADLRAHAVATGRRLRDELSVLRGGT